MEDQRQEQGRGPGRPRRVGRVGFHAQVPGTLVEMLRQDAARQGISQGDRLAEILASYYAKEAMQKAC